MQLIESDKQLTGVTPNIATMLRNNVNRFHDRFAFQERNGVGFKGMTWEVFYIYIENIASNLKKLGFEKGNKILIFSKNRPEMLLLELAVMACGGISVPIFFNYSKETARSLIEHSDADYVAVGDRVQLNKIGPYVPVRQIFVFDDIDNYEFDNLQSFVELCLDETDGSFRLDFEADPDEICLNMYTSGTMGNQKCVQLTHRNILSQQAALKTIWNIDENDRFLSYLRWHHSFGGIFEKFTALYNGAVISLESSNGLDPGVIMENWKLVKPTVFFSVPMVYHQLFDMTLEDKKTARSFFHKDLKFVFTAAAPLPKHISDHFEERNIPVIEGWGLTETSPCCTLTDPNIKREPGVIGKPIPGVSIRMAEDGEMQVKGPNVMVGYYKNDEANKNSFTEDGWFCTGDIGEFTENGLKLITRKDRIFKLSNAEKVIPTELESQIVGKCQYVSYALVEGSGRNYPVALLFPDKMLIEESNNGNRIEIEECACPGDLRDLSICLKQCLMDINMGLKQKFSRIRSAMLVDDVLKVDNMTLTPSMKLAPNNVKKIYKEHIDTLYVHNGNKNGKDFIIDLDETNK